MAMVPFIQQVQSTYRKYYPTIAINPISCDVCQGKGKMIKSKCTLCKGLKVSKNHREISVTIRKGMKNGEKIVAVYLILAYVLSSFLDCGRSWRRASRSPYWANYLYSRNRA